MAKLMKNSRFGIVYLIVSAGLFFMFPPLGILSFIFLPWIGNKILGSTQAMDPTTKLELQPKAKKEVVKWVTEVPHYEKSGRKKIKKTVMLPGPAAPGGLTSEEMKIRDEFLEFQKDFKKGQEEV